MMFIILVYDVNSKRLPKVKKTAEKYLFHIQESVFEGFLTENRLKQLKGEIKNAINVHQDSVILYIHASNGTLTKEQLGIQTGYDSCFL